MRSLRGACLTLVCAVVTSGLLTPASANAGAAHHPRATARMHARVARVHAGTPSTVYGAGYFSYPTVGDLASASVTFTLPTVTCKRSTDFEAIEPGIVVFDTDGTITEQVTIDVTCDHGSIHMVDDICILTGGCTAALKVHPGDRVVASLSESIVQTVGYIHDLTAGRSDSVVGSAPESADHSVFLGDEGPLPFAATTVATFGTIAFSKAQLNGLYLTDWAPDRFNLVSTAPTVQIKAGPLTGDGDGFLTTFVHN